MGEHPTHPRLARAECTNALRRAYRGTTYESVLTPSNAPWSSLGHPWGRHEEPAADSLQRVVLTCHRYCPKRTQHPPGNGLPPKPRIDLHRRWLRTDSLSRLAIQRLYIIAQEARRQR